METLCCTAKYRKLFALPNNLPATTHSPTALGPWYANVLNIGPMRLFHYMSSRSLLSVIIMQRERKSAEQRFARALADLLAALHVPAPFIEAELEHLSSFEYARATDRSILGSMRDQAHSAPYHLDALIPLDLALLLATTPCGPMNYDSPQKVAPRLLREKWSAAGS
jgi:hypothetical protein